MQDCEIQPKKWVATSLWGVRPGEMFATYITTDVLPPIVSPKLIDLDKILSVTACYPDGGDSLTVHGKTYVPFYHDQQDCVIWYTGPDGKIYWPDWNVENQMNCCADSMEEFTTRIAIEASLWHKLHGVLDAEKGDYFATTIQKDPIMKHWTKFTPVEQDYITYLFEHTK